MNAAGAATWTPELERRAGQQVRPIVRPAWLVAALIVAFMLLALALRLPGLRGPDGTLNADESRLALAADGVLRTGLPVLPSGRMYTRGLVNAYVMAGSFAALGRHDLAARLPSVIAGTLLVPVLFLLGRALGDADPLVGLAAAGFAAVAHQLVVYSLRAWLPSLFVLLFSLAVFGCYRGFVSRRVGWQVGGGLLFLLALLSYEFAVLLLVGLGIYLGWCALRRDFGWYRGWPTAVALTLLLGGAGLLGGLALALRAGTLAGPLGEVQAAVQPTWRWSSLDYYWRTVLADYWPLLAATLLGLPLLARARWRGTLLLGSLFLLTFLAPVVLIQLQRSPRYALPALPLLAVLAAAATVRLARRLAGPLALAGLPTRLAPSVVLAALFVVSLWGDLGRTARLLQQRPPAETWVQALQREGLAPTDLLVAESANKAAFYLGRAEFYLRPDEYERYAYRDGDRLRYLYTDTVLLTRVGDFERLVERPNSGRVLWLIGRADRLPDRVAQLGRGLWPSLLNSAERQVKTVDGWLLLKVRLPRQAQAPNG